MAATRVVAKALVLDADGDFLLLQRGDDHPRLAGFYDLPGGYVEATEEPGAAVIREIHEETGLELNLDDTDIMYTTTHLLGGVSYPTILYLVRLNSKRPSVTISWEHKSYEWSPLNRLAEVEPQLAPTYREALSYIEDNRVIADIDDKKIK